jgi:hypothetical protein
MELLATSLVELSKDEYTLIISMQQGHFWQLDKKSHVWGLPFGEQMDLFEQIFDALIKRDL